MGRVLLLSGYWPPHVGGIERYSLSLAEELVRRGWEVDAVACGHGAGPEPGRPGLRVALYQGSAVGGRIPLPRLWSAHNVRLVRASRRSDYDAIIAMSHYYVANIILLTLHRRTPLRLWVNHAGGHVPVGGRRMLGAIVHLYEHAMAMVMRRLTNVTAGVSERSRDWLEHLGSDASTVLRNAVDSDSERTSQPRQGPVRDVLFVGRLQPGKGGLTAVEIVEEARRQRSDRLTLTIAGDGPDRTILEGLARSRPWLKVLGAVPSAQVHELMSAADVLVYPSSYPEGLPTVILEAGARGLAVITYPVAGVQDISPSGRELLVVESAEDAARTLVGLVDDPDLARAYGAGLRDRVLREFTWSTTADRLETLLRRRPIDSTEA